MSGPIDRSSVAGIVLAAGAGRRMGTPKALLRDGSGDSYLLRAVHALSDAGCAPVVVVLGADADRAAPDFIGCRARRPTRRL